MCMRISMESTYASRHRQVRLHSSFVVVLFCVCVVTVLRRESWYRFGIYNIRFASVACIEPFLSDDTFLFTIRRFVIYDWNYFLLGLKAPWAFGLLRFFLTLYPLSFMYSAIYVSDSFSQLRKNRNVYHRWRICYDSAYRA